MMGVVYVGRRLGFIMIALTAAAHIAVGLLVTRGVLHLDTREVDPMLMQNWFRMALVISLLAVLLAMMIDSVIRHVEANSTPPPRRWASCGSPTSGSGCSTSAWRRRRRRSGASSRTSCTTSWGRR